jgi:transposase
MSQPFDLSQFPDLPPEVISAFDAAQFELSVERAARIHEQAVVAEKTLLIADLKALVAKLEGQVAQHKRAMFGPKSERLDPAQLQLALEDIETAIAETQEEIAKVEEKIDNLDDPEKKVPREPRKPRALPENLPRIERVIEPGIIACPCGCGDMVRIGEDRSERIDVVPAQYRVIVTIRPKYACPKGRAGVVQAKAPAHLLEGSWPTEAMLAHIAVAKHSEHMPLNRQARVMARHGPSRLPGRPVRSGRLDGPGGRAYRASRRPDGRLAEIRNFPALRGRNHRPSAGSGARKDQDRLSLGGLAR